MGSAEGNRIMNTKRICTVVFLIGAVCIFKNLPPNMLIDMAIVTCVIVMFQLVQVFKQ